MSEEYFEIRVYRDFGYGDRKVVGAKRNYKDFPSNEEIDDAIQGYYGDYATVERQYSNDIPFA